MCGGLEVGSIGCKRLGWFARHQVWGLVFVRQEFSASIGLRHVHIVRVHGGSGVLMSCDDFELEFWFCDSLGQRIRISGLFQVGISRVLEVVVVWSTCGLLFLI